MDRFNTFYIFIGAVCTMTQGFIFAFQNRLYDEIFAYLFSKAVKCKFPHSTFFDFSIDFLSSFLGDNGNNYENSEKLSIFISKIYSIALFLVVFLPSGASMAITIYKVYVNNMILEEIYYLPFVISFPFRVNTWPRYMVAFTWTFCSYALWITTKIINALIQFSIGFYYIAALKNLQNMINDLIDLNG